MAKPNKNAPKRTILISCQSCKAKLYKYRKGGKGALVKCFIERIVDDYTNDLGQCPGCGQQFGREALVRGTPAIKIIGGKVQYK